MLERDFPMIGASIKIESRSASIMTEDHTNLIRLTNDATFKRIALRVERVDCDASQAGAADDGGNTDQINVQCPVEESS